MKRFLFGFLAVLFLILNIIPYLYILADDMPTSSQYEMLGAYALSTLITSGEATELDFSDYTENDTSFLIDLGEAIFTGDWSGLAEDGLEWLGETADSVYDSYKEYVSQWKSDHLGIMYSNWFPDETIYVGPDDSYSLAKPLRELFTPRVNNPTPSPDVQYIVYINRINSHNPYSFYWDNTPTSEFYGGRINGINKYCTPIRSYDLESWFCFNTSGYIGYDITYSNNGWNTSSYLCTTGNIKTLQINNIGDNQYIGIISDITIVPYCVDRGGTYWYAGKITYNEGNYSSQSIYWNSNGGMNSLNLSYTGTLSQVFQYFQDKCKNVNIYVDNIPWALVDYQEPTYPIVIPGQLTIYNDQPLEYSFPADTHIDLPDLTTIIRNAINSSGVVMWSDIADVFVDVNGQTAVAVTKIVRNDYDNLYMEQYPYPAMLVGMTDQTKFNEHLLDNSHAYLSPMGTVVQETVNILPSELVGVLAIGAILTIFAVIINRLLE